LRAENQIKKLVYISTQGEHHKKTGFFRGDRQIIVRKIAIYFLLLLVIIGFLPLNSIAQKTTAVPNLTIDNFEHTVIIQPIIPITNSLPLSEIGFEAIYTISEHIHNPYNAQVNLTVPEGVLNFPSSTQRFTNIQIIDNIGNKFDPIIKPNKLLNSPINVLLPSNFNYSLNLIFETKQGFSYDQENGYFFFRLGFTPSTKCTYNVILPSNFTLFSWHPDARIQRNESNILVRWELKPDVTFDPNVFFLPIKTELSMRSLNFVFEFNSLKNNFFSTITIDQQATTKTQYGQWRVNPLIPIVEYYPEYASLITVEQVKDAEGFCERIYNLPSSSDNSTFGHYFIDETNKRVIIYPHVTLFGNDYEYQTEVQFRFYANSSIKKPLTMPYSGDVYNSLSLNQDTYWQLNTTNVEIKTILPEGTEPSGSINAQAIFGKENGRPFASVLVPIKDLTSTYEFWIVYDNISLRIFFWWSILVIVGLSIVLTLSTWTNAFSNKVFKIIGVVGGGGILTMLCTQIWYILNYVGDTPLFVSVFFLIEFSLFGGIIVVKSGFVRRNKSDYEGINY
jgi:hypothetical protein